MSQSDRGPARKSRPRIHLAASLGGHFELLLGLASCFEGYERAWVTAAGDEATAPLVERGERVCAVPRFSRARPWTAVRNTIRSLVCALREQPDIVVTTGAGSVVGFSVLARVMGARLIFVETTARVTSASASGRVLARLASLVLVQWPEMADVYPGATVCRPALLEDIGESSRRSRAGTLVAVGTHRHRFDRLLEVTDRAVGEGILPQPVIAQSGTSRYRPEHFEVRPYLSRDELEDAIDHAQYVVCHGGSGIISAALRRGRRPLVLARMPRYREHVDDHQVQIVEKLDAMGCIVALEGRISESDLAQAAKRIQPPMATIGPSVYDVLRRELELEEELPAAAPSVALRS